MKKLTVLSVAVAALLLVGCGEEAKEAVAEKAAEVAKSATTEAKDAVSNAVEKVAAAATEKATAAVDATKEAASAVAEKTAEVATKAKDAVVEKATEAVAAATTVEAPASYTACGGCHGAKGEKKAMGKSAVIAGQSKEELVTKLNGYKAGTLNVAGMGGLMKGQMAKLGDSDIDALATYISGLK